MSIPLEQILVASDTPVREVLNCINNGTGIALVVDAQRHLLGTITDGDVRRAVLAGHSLEDRAEKLLEGHKTAVTAPVDTPPAALLRRMNELKIRHIPLLDAEKRVADIALLQNLVEAYEEPLKAVVMAGGFGKRLLPLTQEIPKPMLPVGDKPMLKLVFEQLQTAGIHKVQLTTHYKPEVIHEYFGNGEKHGLEIEYVNESEPMGTAGALGRMEVSEEPILVLNGDILTRMDFRSMYAYHREHQAELTVAVRQYDFRVPYGVVQCEGALVQKVEEKPTYNFFVNAGIYLLEPSAQRSIPREQRFDMTDLITKLTAENRRVAAFPIVEYWMDIGQPEDYMQVQEDIRQWK